MRAIAVIVMFASAARERVARAEHAEPAEPAEHADGMRANAVYLQAFGKCGLWGLGYERRIYERVRAGAVAAGGSLADQRYVTAGAYVGADVLHYDRSAWF